MDVSKYISQKKVHEITGWSKPSVPKIAEAAGIRVMQVPGLAPRYHRDDVEAVAAQSFGVAGKMKAQHDSRPSEPSAVAQ